MTKKGGLITTILIVLFLGAINVFLFLNKSGTSYTQFSGRFVENIPELPLGLNLSLIIFIAQWVLLILIILFAYARFMKHKQHENVKIDYSLLKIKNTRSGTHLDTLYILIKNKKSLNTGTIAKVYNISKEKALEWAKILENHELVTIEYPTFNDPEVKIYEKEAKAKKDKETRQADEKEKDQKERSKKEIKKQRLAEKQGKKLAKKAIKASNKKQIKKRLVPIKKKINKAEK